MWRRHSRTVEKKKPAYAGFALLLWSGERGTSSALTEFQGPYFFLEAFFLPFFFALAMLALQLTG
jgi:hypothetical protein